MSVYEYMCVVCAWHVCGTGQWKMDGGGEGKGGEGWEGKGWGGDAWHATNLTKYLRNKAGLHTLYDTYYNPVTHPPKNLYIGLLLEFTRNY